MIMNKISACLIVYNEERNIKECLDSIKDVTDEIIVVHDGECSDKTLDICRAYTDKIYMMPRAGFMEAHLPFALKEAANDWILRIDADERLSGALKGKIRSLADDDNVSAYGFIWPVWSGKDQKTSSWPRKLALFRKSKISFLGIVHSSIEVDGIIKKTELVLEHLPGYDNFSVSTFRIKWLGWARLQAATYKKSFKDISKFNYHGEEWPLKIRFRKKSPLLLAPLEFIPVFLRIVAEPSSLKDFPLKFKAAILTGAYRFMVNYYIYKLK